MSTYRNSRRDQQIADDFHADHLPCGLCKASTHREDLSRFGARCRSCYDAYCAEANPKNWPNRPLTRGERAAILQRVKEGVARLAAGRARAHFPAAQPMAEEA